MLAPLAGGPATVELAAAVCEAGGLGFLAGGYQRPESLAAEIAAMGQRRFGVNLFVPAPTPADPGPIAAYAARLAADGHPLGEPRSDDDAFDAKLALLLDEQGASPLVRVVSFTFGLPPAAAVAALKARGIEVWVTVTTPAEGEAAAAAGADALVAQGLEAGGHRGGLRDDGEDLALLPLLQLLRAGVPLIAAGGIATAGAVAAALAAGAQAVAAGTAFLRCPEAGTHPAHRAAVATETPTRLTRAFSGRTARGIVNAFMERHDGHAPAAYPEVHHLTGPLRARARERGDADGFNLWAGQSHSLAREEPAAAVVARLAEAA